MSATGVPQWAREYVVQPHHVTYLTKAKSRHMENYAQFQAMDEAAARQEAEHGAVDRDEVRRMAGAVGGAVRPVVASTGLLGFQQRLELCRHGVWFITAGYGGTEEQAVAQAEPRSGGHRPSIGICTYGVFE